MKKIDDCEWFCSSQWDYPSRLGAVISLAVRHAIRWATIMGVLAESCRGNLPKLASSCSHKLLVATNNSLTFLSLGGLQMMVPMCDNILGSFSAPCRPADALTGWQPYCLPHFNFPILLFRSPISLLFVITSLLGI